MHLAVSDAKGPSMMLLRLFVRMHFNKDILSELLAIPRALFNTGERERRNVGSGVTRTEVIVSEAHSTVTHQVGIPLCNRGNPFLERPRRTNVRRERWPERVHWCCEFEVENKRRHSERLCLLMCVSRNIFTVIRFR